MAKIILREAMITLLCAVAMVLILGFVFYEDAATNKVIPTDVSYEIPENIQKELDEIAQVKNIEKLNIVYTIDDSDLDLYKKTQSYKPGKSDPFSTFTETQKTEEKTQSSVNELQEKGYNVTKVTEENVSSNINNSESTFYENSSTK